MESVIAPLPPKGLHDAFLAMTRPEKKEGGQGPYGTVKFPRASAPEARYLRGKVARQILDEEGNIKEGYPNTVHPVTRAKFKEFDLHFKGLPTDPYREYAVYSLLSKIKIGLAPPVELVSFEVNGKPFPVLLSQTAGEATLKAATPEALDQIDRAQWTWQVLCTFLLYPRDGRAEHYVLRDGKILAVGNENSLRELPSLISALFFLLPKSTPLERSVLEEFCKLDLDGIFIEWIDNLIAKVKEYEALFSEEQRKETQYRFKLILGLTNHFELRLKAHKIQNLILEALLNDTCQDITPLNLLKLLERDDVYHAYAKQDAGTLNEKLRGVVSKPADFDDPKLRKERLNPLNPDFDLFLFEELPFAYQALKVLILGLEGLGELTSSRESREKDRRRLPTLEDLRSEMTYIIRKEGIMVVDLKKTDEKFIYNNVIKIISYFLYFYHAQLLKIKDYDFLLSIYYHYSGSPIRLRDRIYDELFTIKVETLTYLEIEGCKNLNAGKLFRQPKERDREPNLSFRARYPNLKFLKITKTQEFSRMLEITGEDDMPTHVSFPALQYLHVSECPDLSFMRVRGPQLAHVEVFDNEALFTLDIMAPSCTRIDARSGVASFRIVRGSLEDEDLQNVPNPAGIGWLDLSSCPALGNLSSLSKFTRLTTLDLSENQQVGDGVLNNLLGIPLIELSLNHCRSLTDQYLEIVGKIVSLRILRLNGLPRLTDVGLSHLQSLQLEKLSLEKCRYLTDKGLRYLEKISTLQLVNIKGAGPWATLRGVNRLKLAVEGLRVISDLEDGK